MNDGSDGRGRDQGAVDAWIRRIPLRSRPGRHGRVHHRRAAGIARGRRRGGSPGGVGMRGGGTVTTRLGCQQRSNVHIVIMVREGSVGIPCHGVRNVHRKLLALSKALLSAVGSIGG